MSTRPHSTPIAVVGLACRFPGGVASAQQYLEFLEGAGDGVVPIPADRWNLDLFHDADANAPLAGLDGETIRRAKVLEGLTEQIAASFHTGPDRIDTDRSLRDHGLDSIVAVEVSVAIAEAFGVEVSAMDLLAGRSIAALAERIDRGLGERVDGARDHAERTTKTT